MTELETRYYNELYHHGVKGMKWGVRRYQNKNGTRIASGRTSTNKIRYGGNSTATISVNSPTKKQLDILKTETVANGKKAAGMALMGIGGLGVSALMLSTGFISPPLLSASAVSIGAGVVYAAKAAIGGIKIASIKKQLDNSGSDLVKSKSENKETVSRAPKIDTVNVNSFTNNFKTNRVGDYESRIRTKIGNADDVEVVVQSIKGKESDSSAAAVNFLKRYDLNKAKDGIAKEYYDGEHTWIDKDPSGDNYYSRSDFKNKIEPSVIDIDPDWNTYTVYWSDGGTYGGHTFVDEGSMTDMKVRYRSLEG